MLEKIDLLENTLKLSQNQRSDYTRELKAETEKNSLLDGNKRKQ